MKKIQFFRNILIFAFALVVFSCSNFIGPFSSKQKDGGAYIRLTLRGNSNARAVLPVVDESAFTDLALKGAKQGETMQNLGSWSTVSEMQNAVLPVSIGTWDFTLTAKQGGTSFSGTATKEITVGENALFFNLAISEFGTEQGSFTITLNFASAPNANQITKALATLENLDGSAVTAVAPQTLTPSGNVVTFSASNIVAGTYRAKVAFYTTQGGTDFEIASYRELVQISSGLTSTANRTIESFESLFTVTYNLNGGSLAQGATLQETVSRKSPTITLPEVTRDCYAFSGWATSASGTKVYEDKQSITVTGDMTLYAIWEEIPVENVSLNKDSLTLGIGTSEKLTATVTPSNATNKAVTWSSNNTTVAEVSVDGTVTANAVGTATITVTTEDGGKEASCSVTVTKSLASISIWKKYNGNYFIGDTIRANDITVTATYTDGTTKTVSGWTTDETFSSAQNNKSITISYTEDGVTKVNTITITILNAIVYAFSTEPRTLPTGTDGTAGSSATYIEFGDWPQTIKDGSVTIDEKKTRQKTLGMFTYYLGSDGNWYCKALENAYGSGSEYIYSDGTQVAQNSTNSYKWFKVEPIKWRVLTNNYSGKKLIFCESGIYAGICYYDFDKHGYDKRRIINNETVYANNYAHSRIRAWLNGLDFKLVYETNSDYKNKGFLQTAFTAEARGKIATTNVDNSVASTGDYSNRYVCDNTNDKIFLLSYTEVTNKNYGFTDKNTRIRKATDFALGNYASIDNGASDFFLRSPHDSPDNYFAKLVGIDTSIVGRNVSKTELVVVPALCLEN